MKVLALGVLLALVCVATSAEAAPKYIRDQCNGTSGDGQGQSCPTDDHLLIRPKYEDGRCGEWMCCAPNPDGETYDCANPSTPTRFGGVKPRAAIIADSVVATDPTRGQWTVILRGARTSTLAR